MNRILGEAWRWLVRAPIEEDRPDRPTGSGAARYIPWAGRPWQVAATMSAYANHPLVVAAIQARAEDLSERPFRLRDPSGQYHRTGPMVDPVLELLAKPATRTDGVLFARQQVTDLLLTGTSMSRLFRGNRPDTSSLIRIHPERGEIVPWSDGQPGQVKITTEAGTAETIDAAEVWITRNASWESGPRGVYGQGAIRPLRHSLSTSRAQQERALEGATRGRPDAIATPKAGASGHVPPERLRIEREALQRSVNEANGGWYLMGAPYDVTVLGWSPKDLVTPGLDEKIRDEVLAVLGVTPIRIGLATANYGSAREQARQQLVFDQALAALFDGPLTMLIQHAWPEYRGWSVERDWTGHRATMWERSEAIRQVTMAVSLGADVAEAWSYFGLDPIRFVRPPTILADPAASGEAGMAQPGKPSSPTPGRSVDPGDVDNLVHFMGGAS